MDTKPFKCINVELWCIKQANAIWESDIDNANGLSKGSFSWQLTLIYTNTTHSNVECRCFHIGQEF